MNDDELDDGVRLAMCQAELERLRGALQKMLAFYVADRWESDQLWDVDREAIAALHPESQRCEGCEVAPTVYSDHAGHKP